MSAAAMDLWPDDVLAVHADTPSPIELLEHQARCLEQRTSGRLKVDLIEYHGDDREVLRFTVQVPSQDHRCTLFEVHHRREAMLPARFVPPEPLPNYLRERYVLPGSPAPVESYVPREFRSVPPKEVETKWVANTAGEFQSKLELLLQTQEIKALLASLMTMASKPAKSNISVTPSNGAE